MGWQLTPFTVPLALVTVLTAGLVVIVYRNRDNPVAAPLMGFLLSASLYSLGIALQFSSTALAGKQLAATVASFGRTGTAFTLFLLAAAYTDRRQWLTRSRAAVVLGIGFGVWLWGFLNPFNTVFTDPRTVTENGLVFLTFEPGPAFFPLYGIAYVSLAVGTYWLLAAYWHARKGGTVVYSRQTALICLSILVPWTLNVLFIANVTRFDLTPLGYGVTGALIATALFRYRFLDILPIARSTVVESMDNAVFVLDDTNQIVDVNPQAKTTIDVGTDELVGKQFEDVFADYPPVIEKVADATDRRDQVSVYEGDRECHYEVTVSPITDSLGNQIGRTIVFNNITLQIEREQDLDLMRQVLSRVLRHNIRNELQIVKSSTDLLASDLDGTHETVAENALDATDSLVSISDKARRIEEFVEREHEIEHLDIGDLLEAIVDQYRTEYPSVSFSLDRPRETVVQTTPGIRLVFENLIENAAEHGSAGNRTQSDDAAQHSATAQPTVEVSVTETDGEVVVTVSDNGPGIPPNELDVLDQNEETDLEHGSGLGLWVVNWVLEDANAEIQYDTGEGGTEVTVTI